jgi:DNA (cytosine-5)-methyltransferase 1
MFIPYFTDGLGYHIYYKVLNTKDFEIPQNRERVFIVGFKKFRNFSFPIQMPLKLKLKDFLQKNAKNKYFLTATGVKNLFKNQTFNKFKPLDYNSEYSNVITARCNKISNDNPFLIIKTNNKKSVEKAQEGDSVDFEQPNSTTRRGRVQKQISHTIQTAMNHGVLLSGRIRRLTPLECFRLQGFDDESFFRAQKVNSDTQLYKQAGNSITVNVLMKIFEKIYNDEYNSEKS